MVRDLPSLASEVRYLLFLLGAASCSSGDMARASFDTGLSANASPSSDLVTSEGGSRSHWWRLSASLEVVAGQLSAIDSELEVTLLDRNGTEICSDIGGGCLAPRINIVTALAGRPGSSVQIASCMCRWRL